MGIIRNFGREFRKAAYRMRGGRRYAQRHYAAEVAACLVGFRAKSDIVDHLGLLFSETVATEPRLIVELGTRGGESTRVLIAAAEVCGAALLSVDIAQAPPLEVPYGGRWSFVQADDVEFGRSPQGFAAWCQSQGVGPRADVIFIDTSHLYEHTVAEIAAWHGHLAPGGALMFHDTNMGTGAFARLDGSVSATGRGNDRGVIRAIEEFLGRKYDESSFFTDVASGYLVTHRPNCNGFTVLRSLAHSRVAARAS